MTVTDPTNAVTSYVFDIASTRMRSMTDALNHVTRWDYDPSGRLTLATAPEQNSTEYEYDPRGNVTATTAHAKPGSGAADIVTRAWYEPTCGNVVTCNSPVWTQDARGNQTDYAYDPTHGGVTSMTLPANYQGVRAQVRTGYSTLVDYFGGTIYRPTSSSTCRMGSSCANSANEVVTETSYGTLAANNLLPVSVARRAATTASARASASAMTRSATSRRSMARCRVRAT